MLPQLNRRTFLTISSYLCTLPMTIQLFGCNTERQPEVEEKIFTDPKIELLNLALQHEFGAIVQYGNHAGKLNAHNGQPNPLIITEIQNVIKQEVDHSIILTGILIRNNAQPTVAVWPPQTAETPAQMIKKDISTETAAITLYQQILELDLDDRSKKDIENIMYSEKAHSQIFTKLLEKLV